MKSVVWVLGLAGLGIVVAAQTPSDQQSARPERIVAVSGGSDEAALAAQAALAASDSVVLQWASSGRLALAGRDVDSDVPGRVLERFDELYRGVPVFSGGLTRQFDESGAPVSVFGTLHPDIDVDVDPALSGTFAAALLSEAGNGPLVPGEGPQLAVLPTTLGYRLTCPAAATSAAGPRVRRVFIDASTGALVFSFDDTWTQVQTDGVSGAGTGVLGDRVKLAVERLGTGYRAVDRLRRNAMTTYDMRGDPARTRLLQNGQTAAVPGDIASDADNIWTDRPTSSAHAYAGLSLDYLRERHNLLGLEGLNGAVSLFVNLARPEDFSTQSGQYPLYFNNAFYTNRRAFFGVGNAGSNRNFAAGIDVVAHELAHGVTAFSSNLIYLNESGALNEAFSDIIGTATEFHHQTVGTGLGQAEWLLGEDVRTGGGFIRSMSNPPAAGHPHHYSNRFTGSGDNGGVHINSGIVNHMFYLAVVGGTHSLSGVVVQGVGFENRLEIERVIFRAFTALLSRNASFSEARGATIQAARDLYGAGSRAEIAVTQAWNAVGVS